MRRVLRGLGPAGFVLAGLCFLLSFVVVSCGVPGGYGRAGQGGSTSYTGADLVTGDAPEVPPEHLLPAEQVTDDRLGPQPLAIAALALILAGILVTVLVRRARLRRRWAAGLAALAASSLAANQLRVESLLVARLRAHVTGPLPEGREFTDLVGTGRGFWICLAVLGGVLLGHGVGLLPAVRRRGDPG